MWERALCSTCWPRWEFPLRTFRFAQSILRHRVWMFLTSVLTFWWKSSSPRVCVIVWRLLFGLTQFCSVFAKPWFDGAHFPTNRVPSRRFWRFDLVLFGFDLLTLILLDYRHCRVSDMFFEQKEKRRMKSEKFTLDLWCMKQGADNKEMFSDLLIAMRIVVARMCFWLFFFVPDWWRELIRVKVSEMRSWATFVLWMEFFRLCACSTTQMSLTSRCARWWVLRSFFVHVVS